MAFNTESPADGAAAPSSPPHTTTPASCPTSESLLPVAATMNFCSNCNAERLLNEESADMNKDIRSADLVAKAVSAMGAIPDTEFANPMSAMDMSGEIAEASPQPESADLRMVVKFKGSSHDDKRSGEQETTICSPVMLSPTKHVDLDLQVAVAPSQKRVVTQCSACHKRLGLRGFKCRCGDFFCASHRYSDEHNCSFDYKAVGRLAIAKENPLVISNKIIKI